MPEMFVQERRIFDQHKQFLLTFGRDHEIEIDQAVDCASIRTQVQYRIENRQGQRLNDVLVLLAEGNIGGIRCRKAQRFGADCCAAFVLNLAIQWQRVEFAGFDDARNAGAGVQFEQARHQILRLRVEHGFEQAAQAQIVQPLIADHLVAGLDAPFEPFTDDQRAEATIGQNLAQDDAIAVTIHVQPVISRRADQFCRLQHHDLNG